MEDLLNVLPDQEFEVEAIIKAKEKGKNHAYLLKWKYYPVEDLSWERISNYRECLYLFKEFKFKVERMI